MSQDTTPASGNTDTPERQIAKLRRINAVLIDRVERSMEQQANAFSLFQTAIGLETQIRARTEELKTAMTRLERLNIELITARDAAEQANRFKTRFFTAVGHDVLQPLHAARLSLSALDARQADATHSEAGLLNQIDQALNSVEEMLRTILDISRLESGVIKPDVRAVPLDDVFQVLVAAATQQAQSKNLIVQARRTSLIVHTDKLMLTRILQNLLANAIHYTSKGRVLLNARRRNGNVRIEVWDTGPGITRDEQRLIFEEFQRGAASDSLRVGGFGLGLSIAQRMAEALSHQLSVCSRPGHGSCFHVIAPPAETDIEDAEPQAASCAMANYGFAGARVILIENDETVQAAMVSLLSAWACDIKVFHGLRDLAAHFKAGDDRPDLLIADFHLDFGDNGVAAIQRLRTAHGADLPAIVVTADHSDATAQTIAAARCELLLKPVRPAELRALMRHLLPSTTHTTSASGER